MSYSPTSSGSGLNKELKAGQSHSVKSLLKGVKSRPISHKLKGSKKSQNGKQKIQMLVASNFPKVGENKQPPSEQEQLDCETVKEEKEEPTLIQENLSQLGSEKETDEGLLRSEKEAREKQVILQKQELDRLRLEQEAGEKQVILQKQELDRLRLEQEAGEKQVILQKQNLDWLRLEQEAGEKQVIFQKQELDRLRLEQEAGEKQVILQKQNLDWLRLQQEAGEKQLFLEREKFERLILEKGIAEEELRLGKQALEQIRLERVKIESELKSEEQELDRVRVQKEKTGRLLVTEKEELNWFTFERQKIEKQVTTEKEKVDWFRSEKITTEKELVVERDELSRITAEKDELEKELKAEKEKLDEHKLEKERVEKEITCEKETLDRMKIEKDILEKEVEFNKNEVDRLKVESDGWEQQVKIGQKHFYRLRKSRENIDKARRLVRRQLEQYRAEQKELCWLRLEKDKREREREYLKRQMELLDLEEKRTEEYRVKVKMLEEIRAEQEQLKKHIEMQKLQIEWEIDAKKEEEKLLQLRCNELGVHPMKDQQDQECGSLAVSNDKDQDNIESMDAVPSTSQVTIPEPVPVPPEVPAATVDSKETKNPIPEGNGRRDRILVSTVRKKFGRRKINRMLKPKSGLKFLNELKPGCSYDIRMDSESDPPTFTVHVIHDGVSLAVAQGNSRPHAKREAVESAIRTIVVEYLCEYCARRQDSLVEGDLQLATFEETLNETFWASLAAFALYKMFTEWREQGINLPPIAYDPSAAPGTIGFVSSKTDLPPNPESKHPPDLINHMVPGICAFEVINVSDDNDSLVTMGYQIEGNLYTGSGDTKRDAKKEAAKAALSALYGLEYPEESG